MFFIVFYVAGNLRSDRTYRPTELSPGFLFIFMILNVKAVNCFIKKQTSLNNVGIELDLLMLPSVKRTVGCL